MKRFKRYNQGEQAKMVKSFEKSGLSQKEFCEQHGIRQVTFQKWAYRFKTRCANQEKEAEFATIKLSHNELPKKPMNATLIKLIKPNGVRIELSATLPPAVIQQIFTIMGACK